MHPILYNILLYLQHQVINEYQLCLEIYYSPRYLFCR